MLSRFLATVVALGALFLAPISARAENFSFTGSFQEDDDVVLLFFQLSAPANVDLLTLHYGGGTNAQGTSIPAGGFDPILTLFDASGSFITDNDDYSFPTISDSRILTPLAAGEYILALTQFDNSHLGSTLAAGFTREGLPAFTGTQLTMNCGGGMFFNYECQQRTSSWAVDIKDVAAASTTPPMPEPATLVLLGAGLGVLAASRRRARTFAEARHRARC